MNAAPPSSAFPAPALPAVIQTITDALGGVNTEQFLSGIRQVLGDTSILSDLQIREQIQAAAQHYHLTLSDSQLSQIVSFFRSLEGMDAEGISSVLSGVRNTVAKVTETAQKAVGFFQTVKGWVEKVSDFFSRISALFGGD